MPETLNSSHQKPPRLAFSVAFAIAFDSFAAMTSWILAYAIRFGFNIPDIQWNYAKTSYWIVAIVQTSIFWMNGSYRGVWKYFSFSDLRKTVISICLGLPLTMATLFFSNHLNFVSRLIWPIYSILLLLSTAGARSGYRTALDHIRTEGLFGRRKIGQPVVILGAGRAAISLLKEFSRSNEWTVVGLFDDDSRLKGKVLYGVKVLGGFDRLPELAPLLNINKVIIALPSASPTQRRRAVDLCKTAGVSPLTVPSWSDILSGKMKISKLREVELEDLLGRGPVVLNNEGLNELLYDQIVLVTGAGGSIGSELCRKIATFKPKLLVFYELSEPALYQIEQEFAHSGINFAAIIGDVKNEQRLNWIMKKFSPSIIFHAAAYKHVPLMEVENTWEVVRNNVLGTYILGKTAAANNVGKFVLISSDKAVNSTNVMGASKRLAEMVCQYLQDQTSMSFVTVRFGNVLGSQGSVIAKFREQISKGGPLTITDAKIERFFMSIPEAAQLVLQAALMGKGGEIFVLDMGTPIKILDLAQLMIRLSGLSEEEVGITFTGLRPGEKLFEELIGEGEVELDTPHPKLKIARSRQIDPNWFSKCLDWLGTSSVISDKEVKSRLKEFIPEYRPETVKRAHSDYSNTALLECK